MYQPNKVLLKNYADILVKFALNSGKGVGEGEVVQLVVPDTAKPMLGALYQSLLEAGAHPIVRFLPTGLDKTFYCLANKKQLTFFPKKYLKERVNLIDHSIGIIAEHDLHELENVDPRKIMVSAESTKQVREWLNNKEYSGKFTWTLALFGTEAMAKEARLTLKDYWIQIIKACFLDYQNPIAQWEKIFKEQKRIKKALNQLPINKLHVSGKSVDLWIKMGDRRKWVGGSGRNIPSFEIFTSPDWRGTSGSIAFNQPLYRYGNIIEGVRLEFQNGKVILASAKKGEKTLKEMIKRKNAEKIGEFSLTDSRASRITKFMANTLFDENIGGKYGNTHIALGMSYKDTLDGDPNSLSNADWERLGFNDSGEHCDIISTENRVVTAYLNNNKKVIIYQNGMFVI